MRVQVGQYKFGRHRNHWGIWQYTMVLENGTMASFIKDVYTYEEAVREAFGTTNAAVAAKSTNGNGCSREYFKTTAYFDIEKGEWRSFRWESLVKVF